MNSSPDPVIATRQAYEQYAEAYAKAWRDRTALLPFIRRFAELCPPGADVLDAGCGPGDDTRLLAELGLNVKTFDIAAAMLRLVRLRVSAPVIQGDLRDLPVASSRFDGVWANACLLHLPKADVGRCLTELRRVLRPAGVAFVAVQRGSGEELHVPSANNPVGAPRFFARYGLDEWLTVVSRDGFEVIDMGESEFWLHTFLSKP
jgi:ubiquinone/menaquinone biosynthesis C-methylase UbiE